MMHNKHYLLLFLLSLLVFTGCSTTSITLEKPSNELMKNKDKSYISFSRSNSIGGMAIPCKIRTFDYQSKTFKNVGTLMRGERIIYPVTPGKHYFYLTGGENDDYLEVDTLANHLYFVNTYVSLGIILGRTYFDKYDLNNQQISDIESLTLVTPSKESHADFEKTKKEEWSEIEEDKDEWQQPKNHLNYKDGIKLKNGYLSR